MSDQTLKGILLAFAAFAAYAWSDASVKLIEGQISPIESAFFRNIPDNASPVEYIASLKKLASLDWERMITGHPYAGGRYGTKKDVLDDAAYLEDLSTEVKKAADAGKCMDTAMKEVKLPKYEKWANYETVLPANVERLCYWWARGY